MPGSRKLQLMLLLQTVLPLVRGEERLVSIPNKPTYVMEGTCVNLTWSYMLKQGDEISKIRFGTWGYPSYLKQTIVSVRPNDGIYIRSTYKSRISWIGNFSSRTDVQLCDVTKEDQKKYGVEIDIKGRTTLKDGVQLKVFGEERLVSIPNKPTYVMEGTCVNLTWSYMLKQGDEISKIRFGTWGYPSYLKKTIVSVRPNDDIYIRSTYKSRISWIGNFSSSTEIQLCDVTKEDQKKYGVEIDIKGRTTLKDGLELKVFASRGTTTRPTERDTKESTKDRSALFVVLLVLLVALCLGGAVVSAAVLCYKRRSTSTAPFNRMNSETLA